MGGYYKKIDKCLCCLTPNESLLNLGEMPLANDFNEFGVVSESYPLELMVCPNCWHCQLHHFIDPIVLFKNYKYTSGTSSTGLEFFRKNAEFINSISGGISKKILDKCDSIIEIPMHGKKESLNVSVACGVALFRILKN